MPERNTPRVVITHDFMETYGGAERVTEEMAIAFPDAPVYALLGRPRVARRMGVEGRFTSLLPPRPTLLRHYRLLAPFFGAYADRVRLPDADVVLSSSYAYAHRLRAGNGAPRVCYLHSPLRFAWSMTDSYRARLARGRGAALAFDAITAAARRSDLRSSRGIDAYLTSSRFVADQIARFYGRDSEVLGPPVDCERFRPGSTAPEDWFLLCGRLIEPYKRTDVALDAFRSLPHKLVIAGEGPALAELRAAAPPNVEFVGQLEDRALVDLMQRCRAAIFPSRDDFGLVPVEVMACGRPVLAYAGGGARFTVIPGRTGELFESQTAESLAAAIRVFDDDRYDPAAIREHALQWDSRRFRARLVESVEQMFRASAEAL